ncbi:MAG: MATE family efflux transporter [Clostridia bacterium]|nr:MATE family efflux transporter [Clostridia bacterium]
MKFNELFFDRKFWRSVLTLAVPIAVQNLLTGSFALVDTLMVSQLGDISLASVGMAGQWTFLFNLLTFGVASGAAVFFAQFYGEGNKKGIVHTYSVALLSGLLFSFVFLLAGILCPEYIIRIFNRDPQVVQNGVVYLRIAALSYPAIIINMICNTALRSTGRVKVPVCVSLFTTVLNAVLDYVLIFGAFGLPELGIKGAAIATVLSAWIGPILIYIIMAFKKDGIFFAPIKEFFGFDFDFFKNFYYKATPVIFNETMWGMGTVFFSAIFSNMGYEYTAAVSILRTFETISTCFFVGMINASSVVVGKDIGSGEIETGINNSKRFMIFVPLASLFVGILVVIFRSELISIFNMGNTISEKTLTSARAILIVYGIELAIRNIPYVSIVGIFRSGGDTMKGVKYDLVCLWCVSAPITLFAATVLKFPFVAVFACSYFCEDYIKAFLCLRYFKSMKWIKPVTETGKEALKKYLANR